MDYILIVLHSFRFQRTYRKKKHSHHLYALFASWRKKGYFLYVKEAGTILFSVYQNKEQNKLHYIIKQNLNTILITYSIMYCGKCVATFLSFQYVIKFCCKTNAFSKLFLKTLDQQNILKYTNQFNFGLPYFWFSCF